MQSPRYLTARSGCGHYSDDPADDQLADEPDSEQARDCVSDYTGKTKQFGFIFDSGPPS